LGNLGVDFDGPFPVVGAFSRLGMELQSFALSKNVSRCFSDSLVCGSPGSREWLSSSEAFIAEGLFLHFVSLLADVKLRVYRFVYS